MGAHRFDIELGQWLSIALMSRPRGSLAVSEMGGAFYAVGGGTASAQYDLAERWGQPGFLTCRHPTTSRQQACQGCSQKCAVQ